MLDRCACGPYTTVISRVLLVWIPRDPFSNNNSTFITFLADLRMSHDLIIPSFSHVVHVFGYTNTYVNATLATISQNSKIHLRTDRGQYLYSALITKPRPTRTYHVKTSRLSLNHDLTSRTPFPSILLRKSQEL